jgi:hypothetical protein
MVSLVREMLTSAFKNNESSLRFGIVTGILQIAKESIFSGLNHLVVYNIFSEKTDESYGFTEREVEKMCSDLGFPEKMPEIKEWYDGYRFGKEEIYNPWSVLSYFFFNRAPAAYWVNVSGNAIIEEMLKKAGMEQIGDLEKIMNSDPVSKPIDETVVYADADAGDESVLYSTLVMSGYLNALPDPTGNGQFLLSLPNKEIGVVFADIILKHMRIRFGGVPQKFCMAVLKGDVPGIKSALEELLVQCGNASLKTENSYQMLLFGALSWSYVEYHIQTEADAGNGFADIRMVSRSGKLPNAVIELKQTKDDEKDLEALAQTGLKQIHEKKYHMGLPGKTYLYGIAFHLKDSSVKMETIGETQS